MCGGITKKNPDRYCDPDSGAGNQSRTDDLVITNDVLYQLSHASKIVGFSVDLTIISNFSPFVNPFLKIFFGGGRPWRERAPSFGEGALSLQTSLTHRELPPRPRLLRSEDLFRFWEAAGSWGKFFISGGR